MALTLPISTPQQSTPLTTPLLSPTDHLHPLRTLFTRWGLLLPTDTVMGALGDEYPLAVLNYSRANAFVTLGLSFVTVLMTSYNSLSSSYYSLATYPSTYLVTYLPTYLITCTPYCSPSIPPPPSDAMHRTGRTRAFIVTDKGQPVGVVSLQDICQGNALRSTPPYPSPTFPKSNSNSSLSFTLTLP